MAKHASGKNNYRLSGELIALLVVLALIAAAVIWWLSTRGDDADSAAAQPEDCVAGELVLPVAASDKGAGQSLVDAYGASSPVVRDYCVKPQLVDSVADAAVFVAPNTAVTHQSLDSAGRTPAVSDAQPAYSETVGVAGKDEVKLEDLTADKLRFAVSEESAASALVASQVVGNDNDAVQALTDQRIASASELNADAGEYLATAEDAVPEGLKFTPVGADAVYTAFPLNQNDKVDENQARAGQDFARFASEHFDGSAKDQPAVSDLVWAAALPAGGEAITADEKEDSDTQNAADPDKAADEAGSNPAALQPENTLFLLDTSDAMSPYIQPAKDAIAHAALELGAQGKQVGLWNYSSPLNPGVVVGYRQNITVSPDADSVAVAVRRFLTGGVPQTRQAVEAAAGAYGTGDAKTRIVLVTTGTADAGDDNAFENAVRGAAGDKVEITVARVGEGEADQAVEALSAKAVDAAQADAIEGAVKQASGL
ncbi:VWA domain-containing protein [Corynebacterium afermentans]|uniref:vWA domain-containing protein n=1 Tax=Corynebacterium afermentans TaxID=38286 RepID=UPI0025722B44|nr:vWA domain-containing protein [Corynebacterium afermentans]MCG7273298.1 VWA domain-containing protein [Corynebacterium afermentans]